MVARKSNEGSTPLLQAGVAVVLLLSIGTTRLIQPVLKEVFVLLEDQKLAEDDVGLIKALVTQPLA